MKNINLVINKGEKIGIVGLNGSGKTTLIKCICGLYEPTCGEIIINGTSKNNINRKSYFELFSTVFQDIFLLPISLAEIVSAGRIENTDIERVKKCIELVGLADFLSKLKYGINTKINKQINHDGIELSGGEKQKLILARTIYKDAPILLLDEPTAALDPIRH